MQIVKKHLLSVLCGAVALVALVLAFWPLGSMKGAAQSELAKRTAKYGQMKQLIHPRHLPTLDMSTAEAPLLNGFPTRNAIKKAQELQEQLRLQQAGVVAAAEEMNRRPLLVPDSLPNPVQTTDFEFRDRYLKAMSDLAKYLGAGSPPTAAELDAAKTALWDNVYKQKVIVQGGQVDPISEADQKKAWEREALDLPEKEKYRRAEQIKMYIAPEVMLPNTGVSKASGTAPPRKTIWYAQLGLWLQMDVANAIVEMNAGAKSVIDAPVKQWLSFKMEPYRRPAAAAGAMAAMSGGGMGSTASTPGSSELSFDLSPTGRVSNPLYDVVPFSFVVDVAAQDIPAFLQQLSHNRLITTDWVSMVPVDTNVQLASPNNLVYGPQPVARVSVTGEALYLRSWTEKLMPDEVKRNDLGIVGPEGATAAGSN